eukprot:CAMPEP_0115133770 /NCGR_PEP_ID=MMETSP0227-20121206/54657_1 /TAXON_ID=89957 /ORGANISM="Polarella glacialis, Strain CCMP 1383" /LENGTH=96 /DNA_ID=CAMNT_0002540039 /DNA_START=56 /DNA_END=345 /DNA_ORIENTATION=+
MSNQACLCIKSCDEHYAGILAAFTLESTVGQEAVQTSTPEEQVNGRAAGGNLDLVEAMLVVGFAQLDQQLERLRGYKRSVGIRCRNSSLVSSEKPL